MRTHTLSLSLSLSLSLFCVLACVAICAPPPAHACWSDGPELTLAAQAKESSAWALVRITASNVSAEGGPCRTWFLGSVIDELGTDLGMTVSFSVPDCAGKGFVVRSSSSPSLEVGAAYLLFLKESDKGAELLQGAMSALVVLPNETRLEPQCWVARMTGPGGSPAAMEHTLEEAIQEAETADAQKGLGRQSSGRDSR